MFFPRRRRKKADSRTQGERLEMLAEGAKQLLSSQQPEHTIQALCERVMAHLDCQVFANFVSEPEHARVRINASAGLPEVVLQDIGCPEAGMKPWECVHRAGCQRRSGRCGPDPADPAGSLRAFGIQALACQPLVDQGRNIGTLAFGTRTRSFFQPDELELMRTVADLVATAMARQRAARELEHYRCHLETMVAERTAELGAANQELEMFSYAASHDMRAPLSRIRSFSTLLEQRYREQLEGDGLLFLDLIQQNASRLYILVEDMLAHAQIGLQPLSLEPVDPQAAVQVILHERAGEIREGGVQVRVDLPPGLRVRAHPHGLAQVLRNLIENALKYSGQAERPAIEIGGCVTAGTCRLWVRDNGIGIDPAYHERIFEIFRRLHTYSEYPGSGIGLALVRKAMERMGGRVWVESESGKGAAFFLELAAAPPPATGLGG